MNGLDTLAVKAGSDEQSFEQLVSQNEMFILRCASSVSHRYITKNDDEWSIALLALSQAVENYEPEKSGFLSFAELVIRRRLTDYYRSQARYNVEVFVPPEMFEEPPGEDSTEPALQAAVIKKVAVEQDDSLRWEIEAANQAFAKYGFSFFELADCSPKAEKTKKSCAQAVACLLNSPILWGELRKTKNLPVKIMVEKTRLPRKIIERHRKYIIAATVILSGEYPFLAEYMRFIREELKQ